MSQYTKGEGLDDIRVWTYSHQLKNDLFFFTLKVLHFLTIFLKVVIIK